MELEECESGSTVDDSRKNSKLTIADDGDAGTVQFSKAIFEVSEDQAYATIAVTRLSKSSGVIQVDYKTETPTDSETDSEDYVHSQGSLIFGDGITNKTFEVEIINDEKIEIPDDFIILKLSNVDNGAIEGDIMESKLVILDDGDAATLQFSNFTTSLRENEEFEKPQLREREIKKGYLQYSGIPKTLRQRQD